jgi:hypothetical protein
MEFEKIWHSNSDDQAENIATGQAISYIEEAKNNNLNTRLLHGSGFDIYKINSRLTFNQKIFIVIPMALL